MTGVSSLTAFLILVLIFSGAQKVSADTVVAMVNLGTGPGAEIAFDPVNGEIYAANVDQNTVSAISGSTNAVVANVTVGINPEALTVDSANGDVYIADFGPGVHGNPYSFGMANVSVISAATNMVIATVPIGTYPISLAFDPANGDIYVANYMSNNVTVISSSSNSVVATIAVGMFPTAVAFDPNNDEIYVANEGPGFEPGSGPAAPGSVSVISSSTNSVVATVSIAGSSAGGEVFAFDTITGNVYLANNGYSPANTVTVISGSTNSVIATLPVGTFPSGLAFDPSNGDIYVARIPDPDSISNSLLVISGSTNTVLANVTVGAALGTITFDPINDNIYLTDSIQPYPSSVIGSVYTISGLTNMVIANVTVGLDPYWTAFDPANGNVYIANSGSDSVSVIAPTAISSTTEAAPEFPNYSLIVTLAMSMVVAATLTGFARSRSGRELE
jgi:YVTN family beta-propeller protein